MKWFFTFITSFIMGILEWLVKRFGISKTIILIEIALLSTFVTFFVSGILFISSYLIHLWTLFRQFLESFGSFSTSGSAYGVSLQTILSNVWGFFEASGLKQALLTSMDLFIGILSLYFAVQAYRLFIFAINNMILLINDLLKLMTR